MGWVWFDELTEPALRPAGAVREEMRQPAR